MIAPAEAPRVNLMTIRRRSHYYYIHSDGRRWDVLWWKPTRRWLIVGPLGEEESLEGPLEALRVRIYNEAHS